MFFARQAWRFLVLGLMWAPLESPASPAAAWDDRQILELFFERGPGTGTNASYWVAAASASENRQQLKIGDPLGSYRLIQEEPSDYGPALRFRSPNFEAVVPAHKPREISFNQCWVTMPGLAAFVECVETNIPLDGKVVAQVVLSNSGPRTVELEGTGFSSLLYQGSDPDENARGFRAGEHEWRGNGKPLVLAPGAVHVQSFSWDLEEPYLPSLALVEGPAALRATLHLIVEGQKADLACREARLQLTEPQIFQAEPMLSLEKKLYVLGEAVRFWVGAGKQNGKPIPIEYWNTCFLHVTRPDGSSERLPMSWPSDGPVDMGWQGGCNWEPEEVQAGTYVLAFEFAGKTTPPVNLEVREVGVLRDISAEFLFGKTGVVARTEALPVTLKVSNRSPHPVQFPAFGDGDAAISLRISATDRSSSMGMFYPADKLPSGTNRPSGTSSSWPRWKNIPCIQLPPGETYELPLEVGKAYPFSGAGGYEVQFSTTIPLLIGAPDGEFADYCPIRLRVRTAAAYDVQ